MSRGPAPAALVALALAVALAPVPARPSPPAAAAAPDFAALDVHRYETPRPAPAFTLPDLEGRPVSLAGLRGKVVLLFYWTTW